MLLYRAERTSKVLDKNIDGLQELFKFEVEERLECQQSKKVKYTVSEDVILSLNIDLNDATDKNAVKAFEERERKRLIEAQKKREEELKKKKMQENNNNNNNNSDNNNAMDVETTDDTKAQPKAEPKANSMDVDNDATNDTTAADVKPNDDTTNDANGNAADAVITDTVAVNDSNTNTNETNAPASTDKSVKPKADSMDVEQTDGKTSESKERDEKKNDDDNVVLPVIPFDKCLKGYLFESIAADWMSPATGKKGLVKKSYKLKTFPEYLAVKIARYYIDKHWTAQKYEVEVPVPESIDISFMRGKGLQTNEEELQSDTPKKAKMEAKQEIVDAIVSMGFATKNAAIRAALAVQNANADMAVGWLMEHMTDPDINDTIHDE